MRPILLLILDGWGYREDSDYNAIAAAKTPNWDALWNHAPHSLIEGSGTPVGLPAGQMGNSEVGHLNMGAGRTVYQDFTRIEKSIVDGSFFQNPVLATMAETLQKSKRSLHIMGLLSPGGVHSHESHFLAALKFAQTHHLNQVYFHVFLDGRDTPPRSALTSLQQLESQCKAHQCGRITSIIGRYYAMDRDKRWERTEKAYRLLTEAKAEFVADSPSVALHAAYEQGYDDEFVPPMSIAREGAPPVPIEDGDAVLFMNFRADRVRQLSHAFLDEHFTHFTRVKHPKLAHFLTLTEYHNHLPSEIVFPSEHLPNVLGSYIAERGLKQLRIAETEKYAHVTFFFNGGKEAPEPGEDRVLIPSPKIATYDLQPEMNVFEVTDHLTKAIEDENYDFIVCNFANADMVGHTGNFAATVQAIEAIDKALGQVMAAIKKVGGLALVTADHGNAEFMHNVKTGQAHTAHTTALVPLVLVNHPSISALRNGTMADIAPTLLELFQLPIPPEMTGRSLLEGNNTQ